MNLLSVILVGLLGLLHVGIMALEMFAGPTTQAKSFAMPVAFVRQPEAQVALKNQGIYNGMLGVLLLLSLVVLTGGAQVVLARLLTGFVTVVGLYGGFTATRKIFVLQALPGAIALLSLLF